MNEPLVSICIPVYNSANFVRSTLESVYRQTYSNYEVVIQENASTDGSLKVIQNYLELIKDKRFKLFMNDKTLTRQDNWNTAMDKCCGEYIKLLCSDDLIDPECLKTQVEVFQRERDLNIVLVSVQRRIIGPQGRVFIKRWSLWRTSGFIEGHELIRKCAQWGTNVIGEPCATLLRSDAYKKTPGFSDRLPYMLDLDMWTRLLEQGNAYLSPEVLSSFRISGQSGTAKMIDVQVMQSREFIRGLRHNYPQWVTRGSYWCGLLVATFLGYLRIIFICVVSLISKKEPSDLPQC